MRFERRSCESWEGRTTPVSETLTPLLRKEGSFELGARSLPFAFLHCEFDDVFDEEIRLEGLG